MRPFFLLLPLFAWAPVASAQNTTDLLSALARLPKCAQVCLQTALGHSLCQLTDLHCLCTSAQFLEEAQACITQSCTIRESLITKNATATLCHAPIRDESNKIRVTNIVVAVVSAACCLLRFFYKGFASGFGELGLDDYAVLGATALGVPTVVAIDRGFVPNGLARDVWTVPFDHITAFVRWLYILEIVYFLLIAAVKLTLLFFFLRIFPKPIIRRMVWATIIFDVLYGTSFAMVGAFQCKPISHYWTQWDGEGTGQCVNVNALAWTNAIISIVLDIWMLILPLYEVFQLQLSWRSKIGVAIMFLVGTFVTVVSALRLQSLVHFGASSNPTWDQADVIYWSNIEINVGIICACMPSLRVILVRIFPKILGDTRNTGNKYARYGSRSGLGGGSALRSGLGGKSKDPHPITYTKSFAVRQGESDETSLVQMDEFGPKRLE
ncbi:hypothetical protein ACEQ8H_005851 [Pleosporales sp. CAS-2024a]